MITSLIALHKNGEVTLDATSTDNFEAGQPLAVTIAGYRLLKAGTDTVLAGIALNNRKDTAGVDYIPTVIETPAIIELTEATAGSLIASGANLAVNAVVYADNAGKYTHVATDNVAVGIVRNVSPLVIKFTA